ncbi:MAG: hypothetical protein ACLRMJ_08160 [Alistipes finegoldii]
MHAELRRYKQRRCGISSCSAVSPGLSYSDVKKLTFDHIKTSFDGDSWIIAHRQKTGTPFHIKLLPIAKQLIENYRPISKNNSRLSRAVGLRQHEPHCNVSHGIAG